MRCGQITIGAPERGVSSIRTCFTPPCVFVESNHGRVDHIGRHLSILCDWLKGLYLISLSVKRINPTGPIRIFVIRALIGTDLPTFIW